MAIRQERSEAKLSTKLLEILAEHAKSEHFLLSIQFFDGSSMHFDAEKDWTLEIGADYLLAELEIETGGPLPYAPTIIPFTSIKSLHVVV
jgi:hypothetical protein